MSTIWSRLINLAGNITGVLPIANGGTGQSTANTALNALLPTQTANAGKALVTDATNTSWTSVLTNPMTTLGDIIYEDATPVPARLAGNTTSTKNFLTQTGTGSISAVPAWGAIGSGDLPGTITGAHTFSGNVTASGTANKITTPSAMYAYLNGAQAITLGALTAVKFDTTRFDRGSEYSSSTGRFTANAAGIYQVSYCLRVTAPTSATDMFGQIQKNDAGSLVVYMTNRWGTVANAGVYPVGGSCAVDLAAGDTVRICIQIDGTGTGQGIDNGTGGQSVFSVVYVGT